MLRLLFLLLFLPELLFFDLPGRDGSCAKSNLKGPTAASSRHRDSGMVHVELELKMLPIAAGYSS